MREDPAAAGVHVFTGALVVLDTSGNAKPGVTGTGLRARGVATNEVDNTTGAAGDKIIESRTGVYAFLNSGDSIAQIDVGHECFIVDDQTVHRTDGSGTRSVAGIVDRLEAGKVYVDVGAVSSLIATNSTDAAAALAAAVAAQASADTAIINAAAALADATSAMVAATAALGGIFPASAASTNYKNSGYLTVAPGNSHTATGPASGYLRVYNQIIAYPPGVQITWSIVHQPTGWYIQRDSINGAGGFSRNAMGTSLLMIGYGESLTISNTGTTGSMTLYYTYIDVLDTDVSLVRLQLTTSNQTVIPAAASGFYNKFFVVGQGTSGGATIVPRNAAYTYNDDSVGHEVNQYLGSDIITKTITVASGGTFGIPSMTDLCVTTLAMGCAVTPGLATRTVNMFCAYKTFAGVP